MKISILTTDPVTGQEYRITDASGPQWFGHYGPDGSGFGYLSWRVKRRVGFNYADLGYGFRVRVYKGPWLCLFDGQITRITEKTGSGDGDEIELWALGWVHTASSDVFNRIYVDGRYTQWFGSEVPDSPFEPQKFSVDTSDRLLFKPRQGSTDDGDFVSEDDYTYLIYIFPFGESAVRFTADYNVTLPGAFPAKAQVLAGDVLMWESSITGEGSLDLVATNGAAYFEVRFAMTATGNVTAEDDTVYALFSNVRVYSVNVSVLDQKVIADDIVTLLSSSYHGLEADTRRVGSPAFSLVQAAFDTDQTPADVLNWACQFGDVNGVVLAWGVGFDDRRLLFLESQDLSTVKYVVHPEDAETLERSGDWSESAQVLYGLYTDALGRTQRTGSYASAGGMRSVGGYYRRQAVNLGSVVNSALAGALVVTKLNEDSRPKTSGAYTVRRVKTTDGRVVPFDELIPGGLIQIREFRALEAEARSADLMDRTTTFMLAGVRVDYEEGTVELMQDVESNEFLRQMAVIEQLMSR